LRRVSPRRQKQTPGEGKKKDTAEKKAKYWLSERSYGGLSRVLSFPADIDQDKVQAKFDHGVLNVTVSKAEKKGGEEDSDSVRVGLGVAV
jgi:HSP20 family molecular chaperone IbpA